MANQTKFDNVQLASLSLALNENFPGLAKKVLNHISNFELNADILRDAALQLESIDMQNATYLMELAHIARPNGTFIKKKLDEYKATKQ